MADSADGHIEPNAEESTPTRLRAAPINDLVRQGAVDTHDVHMLVEAVHGPSVIAVGKRVGL